MVSRLPVHTVCGIHRDFHPDNILVGDRQLFLIDFDLYAVGDPAIDAGNILAHITEWALRRCGNENALDHIEEAFCRGYLDNGGPADYHRIQALSVVTLVRHIHLSTVRVGRAHTTERLIDLCERRLGQPIPAA
jgi:aminoglycoside phosphotransferase (APT) family kinase protein